MKNNTFAGKNIITRSKKRLIFYSLMMIFPIAQYLIFYVYLNFSSFLLAFQKYDEAVGSIGYDVTYTLRNFATVFEFLSISENTQMVTNSLLYFLFSILVGTTAALVFSYYIYKKFIFSEFFRVILFLPSVISGLVLVLLFKYIAEDVYMVIFGAERGLLGNVDTRFITVVVYNLWLGFGANILMYSGAMSGINQSVVESSQLDGANVLQEFFYVTMPMIYNTFITFTVVGIAGIFTNGLHLYTFYQSSADTSIRVLGYFFYVQTLKSGVIPGAHWTTEVPIGYLSYAELSAFGMLITFIMVPLTFCVRKIMERVGPSVDR